MEFKGYLTAAGKVVWDETADVIAEIHYREKRLNLRRMIVLRTWIVESKVEGRRKTGHTRAAAITAFLEGRTTGTGSPA